LQQAALYSEENKEFQFLQAEDEIAAAIATISASLAGAKAFTSTSGPGFSLMQEALGWGHVVEAPCVFVNSMRVGPSTGMPTQPAQSDLLQIKAGSAGDYYPIAFYPNSVEECFLLTITAFNTAEESLSPVILLADAFLSHLYEIVDLESIKVNVVPRSKEPLGRGQRLFTGTAHDKMGNLKTNDPEIYRTWLWEVKDRHGRVAEKYPSFEYLPCKNSETLLIAFGITSRILSLLKDRFSLFRPIRIYPVLEKELLEVTPSYRHIIVVEGSDGQYAGWVEHAISRKVLKVPCLGGGFKLKWIQSQIEECLKRDGR
jgi:2-oxoglutarate ferredoxin oxidoreductase subunit alpha